MANLLDTVQKNLAGQTKKPQQETGLGATSGIETLLRQSKGKAAGPQTGPRGSALGERIQARQAELEQLQVAEQGKVLGQQQQAQEADIDQRAQQAQQQVEQQRQQLGQQTQMKVDNLLDSYAQGERQLDSQQDLANLELIGFNARLNNDKYISRLQDEGTKKRLDNMTNFKQEMAKKMFEGQKNLLDDELRIRALADMDDREFNEQLANMDINYAIEALTAEITAANQRSRYEGAGKAAGAFIDFAGTDAGEEAIGKAGTATKNYVKGLFSTTDKVGG